MLTEYAYWLECALDWLKRADDATNEAVYYMQHGSGMYEHVNGLVESCNRSYRICMDGYTTCIRNAESYL